MRTAKSVSQKKTAAGVSNGSQRTLRKRQVSTKSQLTDLIIKSLKKMPNNKSMAANTLLFPDAMNLVDEMSLSDRLSSEKNKNGKLGSQKILKSTTGKAAKSIKKCKKRPCTKEEVCQKLLEKCDKETLFRMVVTKFDAEHILAGYKEKRKNWNSVDIQQEACRVLEIDLPKVSSVNNSGKLLSLQKVLHELSNLVQVNDEFADVILKVYGHRLKPEKIFKFFKPEELKLAILRNYTASDLLELFKKTENTAVVKQILEMASLDAIVNEVRNRNDLESSEVLLKALLDKLSENIPEQMNQSCNDISLDKSSLIDRLISIIINVLSKKKLLKTSETLLNFMLRNIRKISSEETKKSLCDVLVKEFKAEDLLDLLHKALKSKLNQDKVVSIIDISH